MAAAGSVAVGAYGISGVGLAKTCRRNSIPYPGRGYWAKREHGHAPPQPQLPDPEHDPLIMIRSHREERGTGTEAIRCGAAESL